MGAACACGSATAFAPSGPLSPRTSAALNLAVGETAPDFSLVDQNGKTFTRSQCKKPLVVYFYPADATPGCTKQATAFQAEIQDIRKEFRADVVGVSRQDVASKQKFAADLGLDFSILADEGDYSAFQRWVFNKCWICVFIYVLPRAEHRQALWHKVM